MVSQIYGAALRGMQAAREAFGKRAERIAAAGDPAAGVDLPTELVGVLEARQTYAANAAVARTADEMLGSIIDILA